MERLAKIGGSIAMVLAGCGPAIVADAEQGEICGEAGPFHVLDLDDDELPFLSAVTRAGDRLYFTVGDFVREEDAPESEFELTFIPVGGTPRVWSTGMCGESPRKIAEDVIWPREDPRWPGSVVANAVESFDLFALDPEGIAPPHLLVPSFPIPLGGETDLGSVGLLANIGDDSGTLALQPYPASVADDPPARVELLADVVTRFGGVAAQGTEAVALTTAGVVVRVDLTILEKSTIATEVDGFALTEDGRFVALMRQIDPEDPDTLFATTILDRETGVETWVGDTISRFSLGGGIVSDVVLEIVTADGVANRVVELPSLVPHDTPANVSLSSRIDESRFLGWSGEDAVIYDMRTGETTLLFTGGSGATHFESDALIVLDVVADFADDPYRKEGPLWRAAFAGGAPQRLADRATRGYELVDDRYVVTALDADEDYLGDLVLVDSETLEEQRIDEDVFVVDVGLEHPLHEDALEDGVIAYGVRDGARSGIWLAKPSSD